MNLLIVCKKRFHLFNTEKGFSIVMALVALALVASGTSYIIGLNKNSKVQSAMVRSTSFTELEKRRISTVLANNDTCKLAVNFGNGSTSPIQGNIAALYATPTVTLIARGGLYYKSDITATGGVLKISNIQTRVDPTTAFPGTSKQYELVIDYSDPTAGRSTFAGKRSTQIRIPMYMQVVGGFVVDCYAMSGNTDVNNVINASCSPQISSTVKNSNLTITGTTVNDCQHNMTFVTGNTSTDCPQTLTVPSQTTFLNGFDLNSGTGTVDYPITRCSGFNGGTGACAANQTAYAMSSSALQCAFTGGIRDPSTCSAGQIIYHSSGTTYSCVTVNCTNPFEFVQSISSAATTCYAAPSTICGANQYVYQFNASGTDQCAILPTFSGNCAASNYGISITRATTTSGGVLNCSAYNMAKPCSPSNSTTFMTGIGATGTAVCTSF
jgi:hypothetical protein